MKKGPKTQPEGDDPRWSDWGKTVLSFLQGSPDGRSWRDLRIWSKTKPATRMCLDRIRNTLAWLDIRGLAAWKGKRWRAVVKGPSGDSQSDLPTELQPRNSLGETR